MSNIFSTLVLEQNPAYVDELEAKYNIQLPPIFKAFVQTFEFGKFVPRPNHHIIHPNEDLGYEGFRLNLNERFDVYLNTGSYYQNDKMLPIITSGIHNGGICVSLNNDKIYVLNEMTKERFIEVSNNIFSFIAQLQQINYLI
ncbi:MAG: SMI1/KNR4 family protein [Cytophagales bacterium]